MDKSNFLSSFQGDFMRFTKWCLGLVCAMVLGIPALSNAFDIYLTPSKSDEAIEYGKKYKGKDIFDSKVLKAACFGDYPKGEGGLVMSKYIETTIVSAMKSMKDKNITSEDVKEIEGSTTFNVVVYIANRFETPGDVQIILQQGTNNILPIKTEFSMRYKDARQGVVGVFAYDRVDPKSTTTIIIKFNDRQRKYKIDFSRIK